MLVERVSEDLSAFAFMLEEGPPNPLHFDLGHAADLVLVVHARKEPCVESHLGKQPGGSTRMTEGIDVPGHPRAHSELLH